MRVSNLVILFLGVVIVLALGACTAKPIYAANDSPVVSATGKSLEISQVRTAIIYAGVSLGWQVVDAGPGVLQGTLKLREHTAVVDIPYSTTKYSIHYKSSINLGESGGQIHKNYNSWVQNFDKAIQVSLSRM